MLLIALGWGLYESKTIRSGEANLKEEKLKSELVLSEKLQLEKELKNTNDRLAALQRTYNESEGSLAEALKNSAFKDAGLASRQKENASSKRKYNELEALKKSLEQQLASLNNSVQQLQSENQNLNNSIASLQLTNQNLKEELSKAHLTYYDKPLVEPLRGKKDKLVAKASRTKKLRVNVMVPSEHKEIKFKIVNPQGNVLSSPDDGTLAVRIVDSNLNIVSSAEKTVQPGFKQMELVYLPKKMLQPGIYQIEVMSEHLALGTVQVRLR